MNGDELVAADVLILREHDFLYSCVVANRNLNGLSWKMRKIRGFFVMVCMIERRCVIVIDQQHQSNYHIKRLLCPHILVAYHRFKEYFWIKGQI